MSDEPSMKIPASWLKAIAVLGPVVSAVLASLGTGRYVESDVNAVRTGAVNRTDANEHEIKWLVEEVMELRSELKELKDRLPAKP